MAVGRKKCEKCGRILRETEFFKMKTGQRYRLCKDCLTQYIDNRNPETFLWILKEFDIPYIKEIWIKQTNEAYLKNPSKFGPKSVIGTYMRSLHMNQYSDLHFEHSSDTLDEARSKAKGEVYVPPERDTSIDQINPEELARKLENGEITQAEYETFTGEVPSSFGRDDDFVEMKSPEELQKEESQEEPLPEPTIQQFISPYSKDEAYWSNQLTMEDIDYLLLKWGKVYTPEQWITMETMYQKYADEYDLNSDREEVLKKMCKTSLKMDEALDVGDVTAYKNLATVFDQLRKSGKFTESQRKEERVEILSTIGELVALCEKEGGIIEALPQFDPDQYPQDKIDLTIKDLKSYTYSLVSTELGLGELIESYIQKLERVDAESKDITDGLATSAEEEMDNQLTELDVQEFNAAMLENDIEAEAEELLQMFKFGGGA